MHSNKYKLFSKGSEVALKMRDDTRVKDVDQLTKLHRTVDVNLHCFEKTVMTTQTHISAKCKA